VKAIDSSSIAKFVNKEGDWEAAAEELKGGCISLELAVKETGNSIWKRVRMRELEAKQARRLFSEFVGSLPFRVADQGELYASALDMALASSSTLYDALFVALARQQRLQLVTSDASQAETARKFGVEVRLIA
jgi:predicted nucleic acid-binding protein